MKEKEKEKEEDEKDEEWVTDDDLDLGPEDGEAEDLVNDDDY